MASHHVDCTLYRDATRATQVQRGNILSCLQYVEDVASKGVISPGVPAQQLQHTLADRGIYEVHSLGICLWCRKHCWRPSKTVNFPLLTPKLLVDEDPWNWSPGQQV